MPKLSMKRGLKDYLKIIGPGLIITIIGFIVAYQFVAPAPPRQITIATGSPEGAYYAFGKAYSEALRKHGITLEVLPTAGSVENLQLLNKNDSSVDVAFLQGGIKSADQTVDIISLGSLYYEPLWAFQKKGVPIDRLGDLKGKRIAVGPDGSGTKALVMQLLALFLPLFRIMPLVYRWRFRSKIYRWYKKLAEVDPELHRDDTAAHLDEYLARLDRIEGQVCQTSVPLSFSNELYHLRLHIDMLRVKLTQASGQAGSANQSQN